VGLVANDGTTNSPREIALAREAMVWERTFRYRGGDEARDKLNVVILCK
jgi:hypothetical protein